MNNISTTVTQRIISTALHQIDVENNDYKYVAIPSTNDELEKYLSELLNEIKEKPQRRAYDFLRETTELFTTLKTYSDKKNLDERTSSNLASRLLNKEVDTDKKYGHLSSTGSGHVKKGSFLQFMYREGNVISYLGVKIDHQSFLDETDFIRRVGLSLTNKIYKACLVAFDSAGVPSSIYIYDTNAKASVYWWKDFLELKELRDDTVNTKTAIEEVVRVIRTIKNDFPSDYTILRNASIAAFKQQGEMRFDVFVENTFANYTPEDSLLSAKLPSILTRLKELPEKKGFDSMFSIVPSAVPFKKSKISLSREITLSLEEGIQNIDSKIWSEETTDGRKLVVINSPSAFGQFKLKEREK